MGDWFAALNGLDLIFIFSALAGGIPLIILFIMQLFGVSSDHGQADVDVDVTAGTDVGHSPDMGHAVDGDVLHHGTDVSFKFLSFQGLSAFFMMFGLVGLALYRESNIGPWFSIAGGIVAGFISVWIMSKIFNIFNSLQSSGTLDTKQAIGSTGQVYLTIPDKGIGKVTISFQNRLREFDATSFDGEELKTGQPVKVVRVDGNILVVQKN